MKSRLLARWAFSRLLVRRRSDTQENRHHWGRARHGVPSSASVGPALGSGCHPDWPGWPEEFCGCRRAAGSLNSWSVSRAGELAIRSGIASRHADGALHAGNRDGRGEVGSCAGGRAVVEDRRAAGNRRGRKRGQVSADGASRVCATRTPVRLRLSTLRRLSISGGRIPIVEGVRRSDGGQTGVAHFGVSDTGSLVYVSRSDLGFDRPERACVQRPIGRH